MNIKNLIMGVIDENDLLNYFNANLEFEMMPKYINGFVFSYDTNYFIKLNYSLGNLKKKKILLHELAHIELNQMCQTDKDLFAFNVEKYEDEADKYIKKILKECGDDILWLQCLMRKRIIEKAKEIV